MKPSEKPVLVGIDTGGTFTDFVAGDGDGLRSCKVLSRPEAPETAIQEGLAELGLDRTALVVKHGSTVATNAVLEGRGGRVVYIANRGLADVLAIGRQNRPELYQLSTPPLPPPVPRELCLEIGGRLDAQGGELEPLDEGELRGLSARVAALAPDAVAINLLFSFLDDAHERRLEAALRDRWPTSRSSQVLPEVGEYERGIATWLNAYVAPRTGRYLQRLGDLLPQARLSVMQSDGLMTSAEQAAQLGVRLLLSGPAGGLVGARAIAATAGLERVMTLDVGGTSTDVALIDGEIAITSEGRIGPYPVSVPMVDLHTVGAGGGSIAEVDAAGMLHVGPRSAGAAPGPACYGRGGAEPTITDAFVVAGRLPDGIQLGRGRVTIDAAAARAVIEPLAQRLDRSPEAAAAAIIQLANEKMAGALRVISVQRGHDPRRFALCAFGGAGGMHACELADLLGMPRAIVPVHAGVLSALGMATAAPGRELTRSVLAPLGEASPQALENQYRTLEAQVRRQLAADGVDPEGTERRADLRYRGQSFTLTLSWHGPEAAREAFHQAHQRRFGHALDDEVELVTLRVRGHGRAITLDLTPAPGPLGYDATATVDRWSLSVGQARPGPLTVLDATGACWVPRSWTVRRDATGNLMLER